MTEPLDDLLDSAAAVVAGDELVTRALSRDVPLPLGAGTMALLTLDNGRDHTLPNTFGPGGLRSLNTAIDAALRRDDVQTIGITGKPFVLAVGADLTVVPRITGRDQAKVVAQIGHGVMRKLRDGGKPSFCFINGAALGGGLELALHCDYRTVLDSVSAIAMPEVFLGLVPGWGGAYLLPNLVGAERAATVIVANAMNQNTMLNGRSAFALGIADRMYGGADFLGRSLRWAAEILVGEASLDRPEPDRSSEVWDGAVARARAAVEARIHGAAPAPYRALDLIAAARTADRDTAFAAEDEALADLIISPELRSGVYAFDLVQKRARRPVGAPDGSLARPVNKVGIAGAGLMATQLALLLLRRLEVPVVLTDLDEERVERGVAAVSGEIDGLLARGRLHADRANRYRGLLSGSTGLSALADADLVIEAVFEELDVKKAVFAELEEVVGSDTVLATNTSSLSVTAMAADLAHPERVVGLHFFNPVAVLPLVEVVRGRRTDDATLATAFAVAKALRKSSVLVADSPAFVVNRLLTRFLSEVTKAVDEGTDPAVADSALDPLGLPMSPFALLQLVGPAVGLHVAETLHEAFGDRFCVSPTLRALVAANKPGLWSWDERGRPYLDDETAALLSTGSRPWTAQQVLDRAMSALAEEIRLLLDEGVVASAADVDLCLILGAGWPFHLGGVTPYLDRAGFSERVTGRRFG
ncbi:MAG: 3-hydroxyacyl-CoA dehydrogenase NAD-binding domain-containing protein [Nocardioidaceae bacterium]